MPVNVLAFHFPGLPQVGCAFQLRRDPAPDAPASGGNISFAVNGDPAENVLAARRGLAAGLHIAHWAELRQVHGDGLLFDPEPVAAEAQPVAEGDGMATDRPGLPLCIKTADCQPILLAHTGGRHIAALHVGWRGNRRGFPQSAVRRFCERYRLSPRDILAVRGPSLGPDRAEFIHFDTEWDEDFRPWFQPENRTVDLWGLTRHQLLEAGLEARHIFGVDICTASNPRLCFSHRRHPASGRQASLIWLRED
ncbi:polyphenol oxidase family protein [uncultured Desulfovibrio sp.]|uniref:polyphenol oxidase family protein n=1 Tax=uncultured Desulfovibrio sp. TaxID=167968 RepID=UPI00260AE9EF|nr:polyphenol oxidase family protein [uncultured Desulfovibrio sp.]